MFGPKKPPPEEQGLLERILRDEAEHPPPPQEIPEVEEYVSIDRFVNEHPSSEWVVRDLRREGLNDEQIEAQLPSVVKHLSDHVEEAVRNELGVPSPAERRPISELEKRVRRSMGLDRPVE